MTTSVIQMEFYSWKIINGWSRLMGGLIILLLLTELPVSAQHGIDELIRRGEAAGADVELLQTVDQRALERGLGVAQRSELLELGVVLAEQGLPADGVLQKTLEGLAKQIPQPHLTSVLSRMQHQTAEAGRIVDGWLQHPETRGMVGDLRSENARGRRILIENVAEALIHDVPRPFIDGLLDRVPAETPRGNISAAAVGAAIGALADLPSARNESQATIDLLVSALSAGYSGSEIRRLPLAMRAAEERGISRSEAASEAARAMDRGTPADDVLRNLFGGAIPGPGAGMGVGGADGGSPSSVGPPPGVGPDDAGRDRGGSDNANRRGRNN